MRKPVASDTTLGRHTDGVSLSSITRFYSDSHKDERHRSKLETHLIREMPGSGTVQWVGLPGIFSEHSRARRRVKTTS